MTITVWDPDAGATLTAMLDVVDVDLQRTQSLLRTRTTLASGGGQPAPSGDVLHALTLADDAEIACAIARADLEALRSATVTSAWSYAAAEEAAAAAAEVAGAALGIGAGTLVLGGLLLGVATAPVTMPGIAVAALLAGTPAGDWLAGLAAQALAPLAPLLPDLLDDPAFVDALRIAVASVDEALAGLTGIGVTNPLAPLLAPLAPDDEGLAAGAAAALAIALILHGRAPRLPGTLPSTAVETAVAPPTRAPVDSYSTAIAHLTAEGQPSIEVQRYEQADGTVVWQVFARGTESFAIDDPDTAYDLTANIENAANTGDGPLVGSAAAVEQALAAAGASSDDVIQLYGYSQGGAAVSAVAAYGGYQVDTVVTFAAPNGATPVREGTTAVAVENVSDVVVALGGPHGGDRTVIQGDPDLATIETTRYDEDGQPLADLPVGGHYPEAYADTAAQIDASGDDVANAVWLEVQEATVGAGATGATGYSVER